MHYFRNPCIPKYLENQTIFLLWIFSTKNSRISSDQKISDYLSPSCRTQRSKQITLGCLCQSKFHTTLQPPGFNPQPDPNGSATTKIPHCMRDGQTAWNFLGKDENHTLRLFLEVMVFLEIFDSKQFFWERMWNVGWWLVWVLGLRNSSELCWRMDRLC